MNMKALIQLCILLSASALAFSCAKGAPDEQFPGDSSGRVCLSLSDGDETKVSGMEYERDEKPLTHWAFFVFEKSTGALACRGTVRDATRVEKTLPTGEYELYVIGNYPQTGSRQVDISSIASISQFMALKSGLADNVPGAFVMAGNRSFTVEKTPPDEAPQTINLRMKRLVSKLTLVSITRSFTSPSLGAKQLKLKHIYLTNVYTEACYGEDFDLATIRERGNALWYNRMGWHGEGSLAASDAADLLTGERNLDVVLPQGGTQTIGCSLYYYPNPMLPSLDNHSETWTGPRCTRLVLETELGGKTYYYQATLPKDDGHAPLVRNTSFSVSCTLTQLGYTDPEQEIPGLMEITFEPDVPLGGWDPTITVTEAS